MNSDTPAFSANSPTALEDMLEQIPRFEFATAQRILFGPGVLGEAGRLVRALGTRSLVVTGRSCERARPLIEALQSAGVNVSTLPLAGEPTTVAVCVGVELARSHECDCVVAFGGGSAIDASKAIAAMLANDGELMDYLEVIGRGRQLRRQSAPCIAIPTTAGTGSEVTRNAVLASPEHRLKVSLRSQHMLPRVALVDPELTYGLPRALTASTGLDALTQLIEPYVCLKANPLTDGICLEGVSRVGRSLRRVCEDGQDSTARADMAVASLFGGLALANAGLGAVHGLAAPIGGMFSAPHGAVCAALLPHVIEVNVSALRERQPGSPALHRYDQTARRLLGKAEARVEDAIRWISELCKAVAVPRLQFYGITGADFPELARRAMQASSMKANPIALMPAEITGILEKAW